MFVEREEEGNLSVVEDHGGNKGFTPGDRGIDSGGIEVPEVDK